MAKTLRDVKVGDTVCVVWQVSSRGEKPKPRPVTSEVVERVGNKYFYFRRSGFGQELKTCRDTGMSVHGDWNARCNGHGFDVYLHVDDWLAEVNAQQEWQSLNKRLSDRFLGIKRDLPHDVVMKIHAVLDEAKWNMKVEAQ